MSALARIAGFVALLAAVFAAASLAGAKLDPGVDDSDEQHEEAEEDMETMATTSATTNDARALPGLAVAEGGYRLEPQRTIVEPGKRVSYSFRIVNDEAGETVRDFDVEHERRMHLIIVRRDFAEFQHLHPRQLHDGSWEVKADLRASGVHRVFADFATAGTSLTLGADLFVSGPFEPVPLPAPAPTADAGDGYEVELRSARPDAGATTDATFIVRRNGRVLDEIEPYLGADGHLVALREHDQAFLHTHPEGEAGGPGRIRFAVSYASAGRYRLFLQFKHRDEVHTAAFTQEVTGSSFEIEKALHGDDH